MVSRSQKPLGYHQKYHQFDHRTEHQANMPER
jgi:hypothetical protein